MKRICLFVLVCGGGLAVGLAPRAAEPAGGVPALRFILPDDARLNASFDQIFRATAPRDRGAWQPAVNDEKARGPAAAVYAKAAPAIVVIRTPGSSGTGAFIDREGWIVTNHHVIDSAPIDPASGAPQVTVYQGHLQEGFMQLVDRPLPALVYKSDEDKDLALVKVLKVPEALTFLELATEAPRPGSDCVAIGHPSSGLLWTVRSGAVSGVGNWPRDMSDVVLERLVASPQDRARMTELLARVPQRKVLVSSCGVNHGDSGGPLLDPQGRLIAVTFAMPRPDKSGTTNLSYHVHLDEVRAFLADRPRQPSLRPPDPWPAGALSAAVDLDEDGVVDTLVFGLERGKQATGILIDLKQASDPRARTADLSDPAQRRAWKFHFAFQSGTPVRAFYASRSDAIDLILTDSRATGLADAAFRLDKNTWLREDPQGRKLLDPAHFADRTMRERFVKIMNRLSMR